MSRVLVALLLLALPACASPSSSARRPAPAISYAAGEYSPDYPSRYRGIYVTHDYRFVLFLTHDGRRVRATGRVAVGPLKAPDSGPRWIDLTPDAPFAALSLPPRLYLTQRDSYQCLSTQPTAPKFWRGTRPPGYDYFCDGSSLGTPTRFRDVP